ncbi:hypothetical protein C2G38_2188576 [Gigaspora rosea]|uniref:Uncharacterized protein n=1 Tax=Gigaspora rosea TaxID=44941 RepID=A0A397V3I8_9GLOM|nr:hypothetical protein C2G38_2188576 [Gigaspora rosea]
MFFADALFKNTTLILLEWPRTGVSKINRLDRLVAVVVPICYCESFEVADMELPSCCHFQRRHLGSSVDVDFVTLVVSTAGYWSLCWSFSGVIISVFLCICKNITLTSSNNIGLEGEKHITRTPH